MTPGKLPTSFWLMIVFGLTCILAGGVVGLLGPRLFPAKSAIENGACATPCPALRPTPLGKPAAPS
jgi:hypothetical protein